MPTGADLVSVAQTKLGKPYVWGAEGEDQFDCSGLMYWAAQQFGLTIPRTTYDMVDEKSPLIPIGRSDLSAGDLILFGDGQGDPYAHVAMYNGDGTITEAGNPVQVSDLKGYGMPITEYRRIPGLDGGSDGGNPIRDGITSGTKAVWGPAGELIGNVITAPVNSAQALANIGTSLQGVAAGAASIGKLANLVTKLFLPTNLIRGGAFLFGLIFILLGIWFLAREVKN